MNIDENWTTDWENHLTDLPYRKITDLRYADTLPGKAGRVILLPAEA